MAEIVLAIEGLNDRTRGHHDQCRLIAGAPPGILVAEDCTIEVDLRFCDRAKRQRDGAKILALKPSHPDIEMTVTGKISATFARDRGSISSSNGPPPSHGDRLRTRKRAARRLAARMHFTVEIASRRSTDSASTVIGAHTNHEHLLFSSIEPRTRLLQGLMDRLE